MYRQLKHFPGTEPYVRASLPVGVRRVVAGLRAGCLPLQIELGRYIRRQRLPSINAHASYATAVQRIRNIFYCYALAYTNQGLNFLRHYTRLIRIFSHILLHLNVFIYCTLNIGGGSGGGRGGSRPHKTQCVGAMPPRLSTMADSSVSDLRYHTHR